MLFSVVESKHKNLYFQFSEKKKLLAYEREEYTLWENAGLQAWGCAEQRFYDVTKAQYGWISNSCVPREPHVV